MHDEPGEDLVAGHPVGRQAGRPDGDADQQEERELQDHDDPGPDQGHLRIPQRAGGEQALHDQLVGAVRGGGEQGAADDAAEQRVRDGEGERGVDHLSLPAADARGPGPAPMPPPSRVATQSAAMPPAT